MGLKILSRPSYLVLPDDTTQYFDVSAVKASSRAAWYHKVSLIFPSSFIFKSLLEELKGCVLLQLKIQDENQGSPRRGIGGELCGRLSWHNGPADEQTI